MTYINWIYREIDYIVDSADDGFSLKLDGVTRIILGFALQKL